MERACELLQTYPAHAEWAVARLVASLGPRDAVHDFSDMARSAPCSARKLAEIAVGAVQAAGARLDADHAYRAMASLIAADLKRTAAARASVLGGAPSDGKLADVPGAYDVLLVHEIEGEGEEENEPDLDDPRHGARHTSHVDLAVSMGQHPHFLEPKRWAMAGRCLTTVFVPPGQCSGPVVPLSFHPTKCPSRWGRMRLIVQLVHALSAMHANHYIHGALVCNAVYVCMEDLETDAESHSLFVGPSVPAAAHRSVVVTTDLVSLSVLALCIWHWVEPKVLFPRIVQHETPAARGVPVYNLDAHRAGGSDDTSVQADVELPVFVAQFYTLLRNASSGYVVADSLALVAPAGRAARLATKTKHAPPVLCSLPSL
jgi:hypothetical protein